MFFLYPDTEGLADGGSGVPTMYIAIGIAVAAVVVIAVIVIIIIVIVCYYKKNSRKQGVSFISAKQIENGTSLIDPASEAGVAVENGTKPTKGEMFVCDSNKLGAKIGSKKDGDGKPKKLTKKEIIKKRSDEKSTTTTKKEIAKNSDKKLDEKSKVGSTGTESDKKLGAGSGSTKEAPNKNVTKSDGKPKEVSVGSSTTKPIDKKADIPFANTPPTSRYKVDLDSKKNGAHFKRFAEPKSLL